MFIAFLFVVMLEPFFHYCSPFMTSSDFLIRLLSEFLGMETMLAIVCKTYEGVRALEKYNNAGMIDKNAGLHGLAQSLGRLLHGRFRVICLDNLRLDLKLVQSVAP